MATPLLWMAPLLSGGGYASEAIALALGLYKLMPKAIALRQFAEQPDERFISGLPEKEIKILRRLFKHGRRAGIAQGIVVCHSTPDVWVPSKFAGWDAFEPCPPPEAKYRIGRTMFETDTLPSDWVQRCNRMDEIWVPTSFHKESFTAAGVQTKVVVIGEAVDTAHFDPEAHLPLELPLDAKCNAMAAAWGGIRPFRFLSVFKWELRKGWDVLLKAFLAEFDAFDPVELVIKTRPFYSSGDVAGLVGDLAAEHTLRSAGQQPCVRILTDDLPPHALPRLYRAADAFVLPSRGEGWGRPHVEAMAMALPVIATNWSGPTAFLSEEHGFPLNFELRQTPIEMQLPGHQWAEPSVTHLRALMRRVFEKREEARRRGAEARKHMQAHFTPEQVAAQVEAEVERVRRAIEKRSNVKAEL